MTQRKLSSLSQHRTLQCIACSVAVKRVPCAETEFSQALDDSSSISWKNKHKHKHAGGAQCADTYTSADWPGPIVTTANKIGHSRWAAQMKHGATCDQGPSVLDASAKCILTGLYCIQHDYISLWTLMCFRLGQNLLQVSQIKQMNTSLIVTSLTTDSQT